MISSEALVFTLAAGCGLLLWWACRRLPGERWQILATLPMGRDAGGSWRGLNITAYGVLQANAQAAAAALMLFMMGSLGVGSLAALAFLAPLGSACLPAAKLVARWVEKKPATFTVGGAFFVGLLLAPWLVLLASRALGPDAGAGLAVLPVCAAMAVSYCLGEGLGRLACISFGCCYGRPLSRCHPWVQRLFKGRGFVFTGPTKKAAYEGGLEGEPVLPVQAIASAVNLAAAMAGLYLFLTGWHLAALLTALWASQLYRLLSEFQRADHRGGGRLTAYQWMAIAGLAYGTTLALLFPALPLRPMLARGVEALWHPGVILGLQGLWLLVLLYTGRSRVTTSSISFHLVRSRI